MIIAKFKVKIVLIPNKIKLKKLKKIKQRDGIFLLNLKKLIIKNQLKVVLMIAKPLEILAFKMIIV